ncbi:MAG TPA: aspartate/glutamate racemase family protein [Stenotrophomonas sp.]|nr:aspartate/glutamate racemase family protein [Stenotrophomonas sp.]
MDNPIPSKTIGLIGGMSWVSTLPYYRHINQTIQRTCGGLHSARLLLYSIDFHDLELLQRAGDWDRAGEHLASAAKALHAGGADFLVLCSNTMHCVAPAIEAATPLPLLHVADATADALAAAGMRKIGLLGTRFTMEQPFYRQRLAARGFEVIVPEAGDRALVHQVIYDELCQGVLREASRQAFREVMARLAAAGAEGLILGCTEIGLLVGAADAAVPLFDTGTLHAEAAALNSLG